MARARTVELKADDSPVTKADRDAEAIILTALKGLAPDIPVVSEETAGDRHAVLGPRFFLVDPLDGTKEFIKQRTDFTVNIALIEQGRPRFGLVYAPARAFLAVTIADGEAVEAELRPNQAGAELADLAQTRLRVRVAPQEGLTALVSLSHLDPETESFLSGLKIKDRSGAGSSVKFLEIARGRADIYPRFGPTMEWDTAAGQAVLEAAGGSGRRHRRQAAAATARPRMACAIRASSPGAARADDRGGHERGRASSADHDLVTV